MTQNQGEMRETHPNSGEDYRYRTEEKEGLFIFGLESKDSAEMEPAITLAIESQGNGEGMCRSESGQTQPFAWAWIGQELHLWLGGELFVFQRDESSNRRGRSSTANAEASENVLAPMPGAVLEVLVGEGDRVERNQTVVIMESMKMELVITASRSGVVRRLAVHPGQQVERGMRLLELSPNGDPAEA